MERVVIALPKIVAAEARQRAEAAGVPLSRWASEVVEAFVAGKRCAHCPAPPAPPAPAPDAEDP
jgi:hypothetical protein